MINCDTAKNVRGISDFIFTRMKVFEKKVLRMYLTEEETG
jgi:hypothetical protein